MILRSLAHKKSEEWRKAICGAAWHGTSKDKPWILLFTASASAHKRRRPSRQGLPTIDPKNAASFGATLIATISWTECHFLQHLHRILRNWRESYVPSQTLNLQCRMQEDLCVSKTRTSLPPFTTVIFNLCGCPKPGHPSHPPKPKSSIWQKSLLPTCKISNHYILTSIQFQFNFKWVHNLLVFGPLSGAPLSL